MVVDLLLAMASPFIDQCYSSFVTKIEYRLAPEHRLPGAYEDCMEVLQWVKNCQEDEWLLLNIKGLILRQPFFGAIKRTNSELKAVDDKTLPPCVSDVMWELSLSIKSGQFDQIKVLGWNILVSGYEGDPLFDHQIKFVKVLEEKVVALVAKFAEGSYQGADTIEFPRLKALCEVVKEFVTSILIYPYSGL
ncbi:hypothetical protein ACH5RR_038974 [Cinchona calisaya]|uniref:Alpha/beta hydrolase fold-3 domain-containing protein n=1 Tax=Cinchona calisaya TaxID=153742 RepID=A0ABD2XWV2_9GENT